MNILPCPRALTRHDGYFLLPGETRFTFLNVDRNDPAAQAAARRLQAGFAAAGIQLRPAGANPAGAAPIRLARSRAAPDHPEGYALVVHARGLTIEFHETGGLRAAVATLRQLLREYGPRLPRVAIRDWPDIGRRGVMLDVSRGRVPRIETLLQLADDLADFKINEVQLYTEHTFAYRRYRAVWRDWAALTAAEIRRLDARCGDLGIDLVPNQNSFGHLRAWLEHPPLRDLAEVPAPYESENGEFLRYPSTLAPEHPGTLPFLRGLYDELLPNFSSRFFNVGCDETWDLGRGQTRRACAAMGPGRVYLRFLKRIAREVAARNRQMMFWGDTILRYPELIPALPRGVIALNWGYEADHPFAREAAAFRRSKVPFYVCPGTSTWMSLIGRHDNALGNLRAAAVAGRQHGAVGYLITDWGDGGHPQPLAVSYLPYLAGAALSWCRETFREEQLVPVLSRDIFHDRTCRVANVAAALGVAHRHFGYTEPNSTPFGTVIAAPPAEQREVVCRNGLKLHARIPGKRIEAARQCVERLRRRLQRAQPAGRIGRMLARELDLAARMAEASCRFMLWQQAVAAGEIASARRMAVKETRRLRKLAQDFAEYWPLRNKGTRDKCAAFLEWRQEDYAGAVRCGPACSGYK